MSDVAVFRVLVCGGVPNQTASRAVAASLGRDRLRLVARNFVSEEISPSRLLAAGHQGIVA